MANGTNKVKDAIPLIVGIIVIGGLIGSQAVINSKVNRNTDTLDTYNLPVMDYRMGEMDKKLDKILVILEEE